MNREKEARLVAERRLADWMRSRRVSRREAAELLRAIPGILKSPPPPAVMPPRRPSAEVDPRTIRTTGPELPASRLPHG